MEPRLEIGWRVKSAPQYRHRWEGILAERRVDPVLQTVACKVETDQGPVWLEETELVAA